jgi:hypothetical protein
VTCISINGHLKKPVVIQCPKSLATGLCLEAGVAFGGSSSLRHNARAATLKTVDNRHDGTFTVTSAMVQQLEQRQTHYNISWVEADYDASWLVPSRLLMYLYVTRPTPSLAEPEVQIDGHVVKVAKQYNSRGNHAVVPAGGGAVSGNTARTFLGWYVDCSKLKPDVAHKVSIQFTWSDSDRMSHPFLGLFWHNIEDSYTSEIVAYESGAAVFI